MKLIARNTKEKLIVELGEFSILTKTYFRSEAIARSSEVDRTLCLVSNKRYGIDLQNKKNRIVFQCLNTEKYLYTIAFINPQVFLLFIFFAEVVERYNVTYSC